MHGRPPANLRYEADPDLSTFFLNRLTSLVERQAATFNMADRTALSLATFSTLLDCIDLGCEAQALAIVALVRDEMDLSEYSVV